MFLRLLLSCIILKSYKKKLSKFLESNKGIKIKKKKSKNFFYENYYNFNNSIKNFIIII